MENLNQQDNTNQLAALKGNNQQIIDILKAKDELVKLDNFFFRLGDK